LEAERLRAAVLDGEEWTDVSTQETDAIEEHEG
jgi:hypothetical protein